MTDIDDLLNDDELDALLLDDDKSDSLHLSDGLLSSGSSVDEEVSPKVKEPKKSHKKLKESPRRGKSPKVNYKEAERSSVTAVSYEILSDIPLRLLPFVKDPEIYFIRFAQYMTASRERFRCVVSIGKDYVRLFEPSNPESPIQVITVGKIFGVISETVVARKLVGLKYTEYHTLIQVDEGKDLLMITGNDPSNGEYNTPPYENDIISVLKAVCVASGTVNLPVSIVTGDDLYEYCNFIDYVRGDENMRKHHTHLLSTRTKLKIELAEYTKERESNIRQLQVIRASSACQVLLELKNSIKNLEEEITAVKKEISEKNSQLNKASVEFKTVKIRLAAEEARRTKAANATMKSSEKEKLLMQLAEYEVKKNAHTRDMNKYSALQSVHERRLQLRGNKTAFKGMLDLEERVETLEDENRFILARIQQGKDHHNRQITSLGKAKKIIAEGKSAQEKLEADIELLQQMKANLKEAKHTKVPDVVSREPPATLEIPEVLGIEAVPVNIPPENPPSPTDSSDLDVSLHQTTRTTINLSDDDDI
eukprot:Tbor_TRINITY_DN5692_c2_g4::TRINITY_DN5692_c2_g4_i1::g.8195::m.8195